jgi:hypothetical protein
MSFQTIRVQVPAGGLGGNLAGGRATGALVQWAPPSGTDAHFVIFNVRGAYTQAAVFLQSMAAGMPGRIPPP